MTSNSNALPPDAGPKGLIFPRQAAERARAALFAGHWIRNQMSVVDTTRLSTGKPMLVQRIDRANAYYYIIPFNSMHLTVIVVIVDAKSGRFKECAKMKQPEVYPKVSDGQAIRILSDHLKMKAQDGIISKARLRMVWKPCEQTQSPYEPLWHIQIDTDQWYIDQKRNVHKEIKEITVKGGSPR